MNAIGQIRLDEGGVVRVEAEEEWVKLCLILDDGRAQYQVLLTTEEVDFVADRLLKGGLEQLKKEADERKARQEAEVVAPTIVG